MKNIIEKAYLIKLTLFNLMKFKKLESSYNSNKKREKVILVIKTDGLGDYIIFRNFLNKLKKVKKEKIVLISNELWKDISLNFDKNVVDEFLFVNRNSFVKDWDYRQNLLKKLDKYDISEVIYPTFSRQFEIDYFISKINSPKKIAFKGDCSNILKVQKNISDKYYTRLIKINSPHEFDKDKEFFEKYLGIKIRFYKPFLDVEENEEYKKQKYFVISPGTSSNIKWKVWDKHKFAKIIDYLIIKYQYEIIMIGSKAERVFIDEIISLCDNTDFIENKAGIGLKEVVDIINSSNGFVSNDTGTAHICVALDKKLFLISNGTHYKRFHPYKNYDKAEYVYPKEFNKSKLTKRGRCFMNINKILFEDLKEKINNTF